MFRTNFKLELTLKDGINLVTSCCQLCNVEAGAITKNGPHVLCVYKVVPCYLKRYVYTLYCTSVF